MSINRNSAYKCRAYGCPLDGVFTESVRGADNDKWLCTPHASVPAELWQRLTAMINANPEGYDNKRTGEAAKKPYELPSVDDFPKQQPIEERMPESEAPYDPDNLYRRMPA